MQYEINQEARIPFLPGNSFSDNDKKDFRKVHTLDYKNGYSIKKSPTLGIGLEPIELHPEYTTDELIQMVGSSSSLTYGTKQYHAVPAAPRFVPAHVAYDKVLLRFDAYFKETVHESVEQYHLRKVKIYYFLEDDSISVVEPPIENSGIPQKVFIKRQRLPKKIVDESLDDGEYLPATAQEYYTVKDFNLGINMTFYSRTFRIIGCDKFTQHYMTQTEKITLNPPEKMPTDPYIEFRTRARRDYTVPSICPSIRHNDKLKKFLENDRKVLRFFCVWDDRINMFGELREFVLHYYLVDDCIEIRESPKANNGRDPFPILLKKQNLPKSQDNNDFYTWKDLHVGAVIYVLGRPFLLRDCDDATRKYYAQNHPNPPPMNPIAFPLEDDNSTKIIQQETPPYNGYGTIDDSLGSCKYLVLKAPKKDFVKLLENDHKILRFVAKMESVHKEDKTRRFVISYRLADDHITIYEPPQKNSGTLGGKFLERTLVLKPNSLTPYSSVSPIGLTVAPEYYRANDLYVDAHLQINHHKFVILDADEYVFDYMEQRQNEFPKSDFGKVMQEIKGRKGGDEIERELKKMDDGQGKVDRKRVVEVVQKVWEGLSQHAIITVCRRFEDKYRHVDYAKMMASFLV